MLTIMEEKYFFNGGQKIRVPLELMVAASTDYPKFPEFAPLFDRFLVRLEMERFSSANELEHLLNHQEMKNAKYAPHERHEAVRDVKEEHMLDSEMLRYIREESARRVRMSRLVRRVLSELPIRLRGLVDISERRVVGAFNLLQVAAWTRAVCIGASVEDVEIMLCDLPVLRHVFAHTYIDQEVLARELRLILERIPQGDWGNDVRVVNEMATKAQLMWASLEACEFDKVILDFAQKNR